MWLNPMILRQVSLDASGPRRSQISPPLAAGTAKRFSPLARTRSARMRFSRGQFGNEQTRLKSALAAQVDPRRPLSTRLPGGANTSSFPKKPVKGIDSRLGHVMLNALRVGFGRFCRNANG